MTDNKKILTMENMIEVINPLAEKYHIREIKTDSDFYKSVMRERVKVA